MSIRIESMKYFVEMMRNKEIKKEWSILEMYGFNKLIKVVFQDCLEQDTDEINTSLICRNGVLEMYLYEGFEYMGVRVNRAYISENGDVVLMEYFQDNILIIENSILKADCFKNYKKK